jgi:hypothetical protein
VKQRFPELPDEVTPYHVRIFYEMYQEWRQLLGEDILPPLSDYGSGPCIWSLKDSEGFVIKWDLNDQNSDILLNVLMSYSFKLDSADFLDGRIVAVLPEGGHAVVPAETIPGDVIHTLVLENELHFLVLRPLIRQEGWGTEDRIILERIPHLQGGADYLYFDYAHQVKHFRFIGTAWIQWVDRIKDLQRLRLQYLVALH